MKPEAGGVTCGVGRLSVEAPRIDPGFVWRETRRDDDADDGRTGRTPRRRTRCCCTPHYATVGLPMKTSASDEAVRETFVASENDAAQKFIATTGRHRRRRRRSRCEHKHLSTVLRRFGVCDAVDGTPRRQERRPRNARKAGRRDPACRHWAHRMVCGHDGLEVEVGRAAIGPNASAGRTRSSRPTFIGIVLVSRAIVVRAWREQDDHEHECE